MTQVIRSEYRLSKCWLTKLSNQFSNIDQKIKATHGVAKKTVSVVQNNWRKDCGFFIADSLKVASAFSATCPGYMLIVHPRISKYPTHQNVCSYQNIQSHQNILSCPKIHTYQNIHPNFQCWNQSSTAKCDVNNLKWRQMRNQRKGHRPWITNLEERTEIPPAGLKTFLRCTSICSIYPAS